MRRMTWLATLLLAVGCKSSPKKEEAKKTEPKKEEVGKTPSELEKAESQLAREKRELEKIDAQLAKNERERKDEEAKPTSEDRTRRLSELTTLRATLQKDRQSVAQEVATLEAKVRSLKGAGGESEAAKALREMEEETRKAEESERLKEIAKAEEAKRKRMEEDAAKVKAEGGGEKKAEEIFEEKWGPTILRIKAELARYKRW